MDVLLWALGLQVAGGMLAFCLGRWSRPATLVGAGTAVLAAGLGLFPAVGVLCDGEPISFSVDWDSLRGPFAVVLDSLGAAFLIPVQVLSALAAVYGANYLLTSGMSGTPALRSEDSASRLNKGALRSEDSASRLNKDEAERSLGSPWLFFNLFVAGMSMVVLAGTAFLFLFAWEIMSLSAFFLVTFDQDRAEVRRAGWVYLVAAHLGVAFLIATFLLLGRHSGSLTFAAYADMPAPDPVFAGVLFVLAAVGFGTKAGVVPLHVWLPEAHPAAPSHVSALMSGVMIKMGIYGLLRVLTFLGPPAPWWGAALAAAGLVTAVVGISLAVSQRDVKRVLAYSSIENVGIITLALGIGLWGRANGQPSLAALGFTAALLHVWNHALLKALLFLSAGSVLHGTGTRDMEHLGGLLKRMPATGSLMILSAAAIAALPPLNAFTSKWLVYLGLLECGVTSPGADRGLLALLAVAVLALVGAVAAMCYARLCGIVLLGTPRSRAAEHAHESSAWMLGPMILLALLSLTVAVVPSEVASLQAGAVRLLLYSPGDDVLGEPVESVTDSLSILGIVNICTLAALGLAGCLFRSWLRRGRPVEGATWGCGYVRPTQRMQYTGRSFSEMLAEHLLPRFLRPHGKRPLLRGLFPLPGDFHASNPDPVSEGIYDPFFARCARYFSALRVLQQGRTHVYLVYILVTLLAGLAWVSLRSMLPGGAP